MPYQQYGSAGNTLDKIRRSAAIDILTRNTRYAYESTVSSSSFQSSNSIGQFIIHDYMGICAVALTTP